MTNFKIIDANGEDVAVGTRVIFGGPTDEAERIAQTGVVTKITDPDIDYDDEMMRPVQYPPVVTIEFEHGVVETAATTNVTTITWNDYPDGPAFEDFQCEDIEVVPPTLAERLDTVDPDNIDYAHDEDDDE